MRWPRSCRLPEEARDSAILTFIIEDSLSWNHAGSECGSLERALPDGSFGCTVVTRCLWRYRLHDEQFAFVDGTAELDPGIPDASPAEVVEFLAAHRPFEWAAVDHTHEEHQRILAALEQKCPETMPIKPPVRLFALCEPRFVGPSFIPGSPCGW